MELDELVEALESLQIEPIKRITSLQEISVDLAAGVSENLQFKAVFEIGYCRS